MKFLLFILILTINFKNIVSIQKKRKHHHHKIFFLNDYFQWQKSTWVVSRSGQEKIYEFTGELNANDRGIYFKNFQENQPGLSNLDFFNQETYSDKSQGKANVLDFALVKGCFFEKQNTGILSGYKFKFSVRNFESQKQLSYDVTVSYKLGSGFLGGLNIDTILASLTQNCQNRQFFIEEQNKKIKQNKEKQQKELYKQQSIQLELQIKQQQLAEKDKIQQDQIKYQQELAQKQLQEEAAKKQAAEAAAKKQAEEIQIQKNIQQEKDKQNSEQEKKKIEDQVKKQADDEAKQKLKKLAEDEKKNKQEDQKRSKLIENLQRSLKDAVNKQKVLDQIQKLQKISDERIKEAAQIAAQLAEAERQKKINEKLDQDLKQKKNDDKTKQVIETSLSQLKDAVEQKKQNDIKKAQQDIVNKTIAENVVKQSVAQKIDNAINNITKQSQNSSNQSQNLTSLIVQALQKQIQSLQKKSVSEEKLRISLDVNRINVKYDCGWGNALFITGENEELGNWKVARKLQILQSNLWLYASETLKDGVQFKIIKGKWINEQFLILDNKVQIHWEGAQGSAGNRVTQFSGNNMDITPAFQFRKIKKNHKARFHRH